MSMPMPMTTTMTMAMTMTMTMPMTSPQHYTIQHNTIQHNTTQHSTWMICLPNDGLKFSSWYHPPRFVDYHKTRQAQAQAQAQDRTYTSDGQDKISCSPSQDKTTQSQDKTITSSLMSLNSMLLWSQCSGFKIWIDSSTSFTYSPLHRFPLKQK